MSRSPSKRPPKLPVGIASRAFIRDRARHYRWMHAEAPIFRSHVSVMRAYFVAPYADCITVTKDPRLVRNRTTATGGGRLPFPVPRAVEPLLTGMINDDGAVHRRKRTLVSRAFTPRALKRIADRIESLTHELLDKMPSDGPIDLIPAYSLPIPVTVIREMLGVPEDDMPQLRNGLRALSSGLSGLSILRTMFIDLPRTMRFMDGVIERKREAPGDDILTALVQAEEAGDTLTHDELKSMLFLLIIAGYETTVHLITNAVVTLLTHPEQLEEFKSDPTCVNGAIEEVLRFAGPIQSTKPEYAIEDIEIRGFTIPKGSAVMPVLGAANRDPEVFEDPDTFDIRRTPNKHLAFGQGPHFCLGAALARMEARIALKTLFERFPDTRLAVKPDALRQLKVPMWQRYAELPVTLA